jgi:ribosomal-protein-alanine N-acetyltransferase
VTGATGATGATGEVRTDRLVLRPIRADDLDAFAAIYADPAVVRFISDGTTASRDETAEWLERTMLRNDLDGWDMRSVVRAADGAVLGRCGIAVREIDGRVEREVGYLLGREHWGRGYATEAAAAMRDRALDALGLRRLIALIQHANDASKRVAAKVGLTYERDVEFHDRPVELHALEV